MESKIRSMEDLASAINYKLKLESQLSEIKFDVVEYVMAENMQAYIKVDWRALARLAGKINSK